VARDVRAEGTDRVARTFRTLKRPGTSEFVIKRSRFLGSAQPVRDEAAFQELLARVRATHPEASHHAYAYRLGREGETARFSDAGEPGGTAGRPMMEALLRDELVDAAVVVTRYFGGTLLGSGGLTRAYSQTAVEALHAAGFARMLPHTEMVVTVEYSRYGALEQALQHAGLGVAGTSFTDCVSVVVRVPSGKESSLASLVADVTAGAGLIEPGATVYLSE
jgi:uncharacterized YigZ family protein